MKKIKLFLFPLRVYKAFTQIFYSLSILTITRASRKLYKQYRPVKRSWPVSCDFGANTTDDDCEQQLSSVAICLQQLTTPAARIRWSWVYNSCGLTTSRTRGHINIRTFLYLITEYLPRGTSWVWSECDNKISDSNFLIVSHEAVWGLTYGIFSWSANYYVLPTVAK